MAEELRFKRSICLKGRVAETERDLPIVAVRISTYVSVTNIIWGKIVVEEMRRKKGEGNQGHPYTHKSVSWKRIIIIIIITVVVIKPDLPSAGSLPE